MLARAHGALPARLGFLADKQTSLSCLQAVEGFLPKGGVACPCPTGLLIVAIARMSREAAKEGELRAKIGGRVGVGERRGLANSAWGLSGVDLWVAQQQSSWHSHGPPAPAVCRSLLSLSLLGVCRHVACKCHVCVCVGVYICVCACLNVYLNRPVLAHHFVGCQF